MNMKRIARYLEGVPSAKCLIEIITCPQSANVCAVERSDTFCVVTNTTVSEHEFCRTELYALTTGIAEGVSTEHLLKELGHEGFKEDYLYLDCSCLDTVPVSIRSWTSFQHLRLAVMSMQRNEHVRMKIEKLFRSRSLNRTSRIIIRELYTDNYIIQDRRQ